MKKTYLTFCPNRYTEIENYDKALADNFKGWICHHKLGEHCFTTEELKKFGMYYDVTPGELIFLTRAEHMKLHKVGSGTQYEKGHKQKLTAEWKRKISESHKGLPGTWNGRKHSSNAKTMIGDAQRGRKWFTNGVTNVKSYECPPGYRPGITR